jgi:hypothetical protein
MCLNSRLKPVILCSDSALMTTAVEKCFGVGVGVGNRYGP